MNKSLSDYIEEAQEIQRKRDTASCLAEYEYYESLLDSAVDDIIYIQNHPA